MESGLHDSLIESFRSMPLQDFVQFIERFKEEFGVTDAPIMMAAGPAAAAPQVEEKTEFTVKIKSVDPAKKIAVIKEFRAISGLGLAEAKSAVESAPFEVKSGITKDEAEKLKKQLEEAGAVVEVE